MIWQRFNFKANLKKNDSFGIGILLDLLLGMAWAPLPDWSVNF